MISDQVLVFEIQAQYGSFQVPEATRSPISFPFTRTAIIGLIGAILGRERNSYWNDEDSLGNAKIALEIVKPIVHVGLMVNYTHTRDVITIGSGKNKLKTFLPQAPGKRGYVTAVRLDLLHDVYYRIYFYSENNNLMTELGNAIQDSLFEFPPHLGHVNLLADVSYVGFFPVQAIRDKTGNVDTVIGTSLVDDKFLAQLESRITMIPGIPIRMITNRMKTRKIIGIIQENFLFSENGGAIPISTVSPGIIHKVVFPENPKFICFMPNGLGKEALEVNERIFRFGG